MRRYLLALSLFLALFSASLFRLDVAVRAQTAAEEPLRTAGDRPIDINRIRLDLQVDLPNKTMTGEAKLSFHALRDLDRIRLDAVDFTIEKVTLIQDKKTTAVHFNHDGKNLVVDLPSGLKAGDAGVLVIAYKVRDPQSGLHFFAPTKSQPDVPLTVWSQGEPITNRYWIPCLDQPNQRQSTELVVTVAEGFEVLSNGTLVERKENDNKTVTFHWLQEKPHPSYLVTLVVGQFDVVREEWNKIPVAYYVPKGRKEDVARTFGRTREMLEFFSQRFGVNYPWEKYAQVVVEQFTSGGMENTSATTLTDRALRDERAMLDSTSDFLIAHELAHQWWGDMVTCRDWSHLWLNEGFASYAEALWDEHKLGADEYAYTMLVKARAAIVGGKERPMVDPHYAFPRSMFDARSYPKGAFVLHMLRQRLGEEAFWKGLQRYGTDNRLQSVETRDFRRALEKVSGRDLERFFYDWAERPGHPTLEIATEVDAEKKQLRVLVKQTQPGETFHFPLKILVAGTAQGKPVSKEVEITVTRKDQEMTLPLEKEMFVNRVEIDPDQAVLAEIKETKGRDLWLNQLTESKSILSRIRAAEHFGASKLPPDREALANRLKADKFWGVQVEIAAALAASGGEQCREALVAGLTNANPKVRRACAESLGKLGRNAAVATALKGLLQKGDASYFVEAAALASYAKMEQADTVSVLLPWLAKPSYSDTLSTAAIRGLGDSRDVGAIDPLVSLTKPGKSRGIRLAALSALAKLAKPANGDKKVLDRIESALTACLEGEMWPIRMAAVNALRDFSEIAPPSLTALEAIAQHDPEDRVQEAARKAIKVIKDKGGASSEITKLREELEKLKKTQDALRERLDKYEKLERKGN